MIDAAALDAVVEGNEALPSAMPPIHGTARPSSVAIFLFCNDFPAAPSSAARRYGCGPSYPSMISKSATLCSSRSAFAA
jgi:hypothetical protein